MASISSGILLRKAFAPLTAVTTGASLILLNSLIQSSAASSAGFINTFCMRQSEIKNGIEVYTDEKLT